MGCGCGKRKIKKISRSNAALKSAPTKNNTENKLENKSKTRESKRKRRIISIKAMSSSTFSKKS